MTNRTDLPAAPAPGTTAYLAACAWALALTAPQRAALASLLDTDTPGMGMHAARRQVLEARGLIVSERVGTGRGAWTRVDLTTRGTNVLALLLAEDEASRAADAANARHDAEVRTENEAARAEGRLARPVRSIAAEDRAPEVCAEAQPEPAQPADRERIRAAGERGAWALYATTDREYGYRRGETLVSASFNDDGALVTGSLRVDGVRTPLDTQRADRVVMWLDEVADHQDAQDADEAPEPDEPAAIEDEAAAMADRVVELEREVERLAGVDQGLADADDRIAELERRAANQAESYRAVRARVTELEDQRAPARGALHDLVAALQAQTPGVSFRVSGAVLALGKVLGVAIPGPFVVEPGPDAPRDGHRPSLVLVDEVVPEVVGAPEPTTVREALALDGHITGPIPALLPGQTTDAREYVLQHYGACRGPAPQRVRVYGALRRLRDQADGQPIEVLAVDARERAPWVPVRLVLPYLAAVRAAGFPGPVRRLAILEALEAGHPAVGGSAG